MFPLSSISYVVALGGVLGRSQGQPILRFSQQTLSTLLSFRQGGGRSSLSFVCGGFLGQFPSSFTPTFAPGLLCSLLSSALLGFVGYRVALTELLVWSRSSPFTSTDTTLTTLTTTSTTHTNLTIFVNCSQPQR